jgi:Fe2+ or Zn2+ uptake regulation protein
LEDRRLTMLGLRGRVIAAICEEEWPHPDNEVNSTTIYERLKRDGDNASEAEVRQVLLQLAALGDITLVLEPGRASGPVVADVDPELCP